MNQAALTLPKIIVGRQLNHFSVRLFIIILILITLILGFPYTAPNQSNLPSPVTDNAVPNSENKNAKQSDARSNIPVSLSDEDVLETIKSFQIIDPLQSVKRFQSRMPPAVVDNRKRQEILRNLPEIVRRLQINDTELTEKFRKFIAPILKIYARENIYDIVIFRHKTPVFFSDTGVVLVISTGMIERTLSDDELLGYTLHEVAHEYFAKYSIYSRHLLKLILEGDSEPALKDKLSETLAIIELECDAFATFTLLYMNYQPLAFIEGIEGIGRDFPLHGVGFHPADAVRLRLVEQILPANYIQIKPSISLSLQVLKDTVKKTVMPTNK